MSEIAWLVAHYLGYSIVLLALNGALTFLRLGQRKLRYSKEVNNFRGDRCNSLTRHWRSWSSIRLHKR